MTVDGEAAELPDGTVKGDEIYFAIASGAALLLTVTGCLEDAGEILRIGEGSFKRRK